MKDIWRLNVSPRIKGFLYKLAYYCLPTCGLLVSRKILGDSRCVICDSPKDNIEHLMFYCFQPKRIWNEIWDGNRQVCLSNPKIS